MLKIYYHLKNKIHIVKVYRLLNDKLFRNLIIYRMVVLQLPVQSVLMSSNLAHGEVYLIQHYVIQFVSDLQQIGGFLRYAGFLHQ
jgi:hypothetical protein